MFDCNTRRINRSLFWYNSLDSSWARQRARSATFMVSESLFPIDAVHGVVLFLKGALYILRMLLRWFTYWIIIGIINDLTDCGSERNRKRIFYIFHLAINCGRETRITCQGVLVLVRGFWTLPWLTWCGLKYLKSSWKRSRMRTHTHTHHNVC